MAHKWVRCALNVNKRINEKERERKLLISLNEGSLSVFFGRFFMCMIGRIKLFMIIGDILINVYYLINQIFKTKEKVFKLVSFVQLTNHIIKNAIKFSILLTNKLLLVLIGMFSKKDQLEALRYHMPCIFMYKVFFRKCSQH